MVEVVRASDWKRIKLDRMSHFAGVWMQAKTHYSSASGPMEGSGVKTKAWVVETSTEGVIVCRSV